MTNLRVGLILAGGKARRFDGQDKGELILKGRRLFDHVYERLTPQVDEVWVSGSHDYGSGAKVLPDFSDGPRGPVAGIFSAYHFCKSINDITGFMTVPVDGPAFPDDIYSRLSRGGGSSIASERSQLHPTFAYWIKEDLETAFRKSEALGSISLKDLASRANAKTVIFAEPKAFENINTKDDLIQARTNF